MLTSYQTREDQNQRRIWIDTELLPTVVGEAHHIGVFNVSQIPDGTTPVKYQSDYLPFDIDNKLANGTGNIPKSTDDAIALIKTLVDLGTPLNSIKIFSSGSKGYHILIQTKSFGCHRQQENLPNYFRYMASVLAGRAGIAVDLSIYNGGQGATLRAANMRRSNGKYKVQISYDELLEIQANPEKYAELTSTPRATWQVETAREVDELLVLVGEARLAFEKPKITTPTDITALKGAIPKCVPVIVSGACGGAGRTNAVGQTIARLANEGWVSESDLELAAVNNATENTNSNDLLKQIKSAQKSCENKEFSCGYVRGLQDFNVKENCKGCALHTQAKKAEYEAKTHNLVGKIFSTKAHHKALTKAIKEATDLELRTKLFDTLIRCNAPRIPGWLSLKTAVKRLAKICPDLHETIEPTLKSAIAERLENTANLNTLSERENVTRINCDGMGVDIANEIYQRAIAPNLPTLEKDEFGIYDLVWVYPKTKKTFILDSRGMNSQKTRTMMAMFKMIEQARADLWELIQDLPIDDRTRLAADLGVFMAALYTTHRVALTKSAALDFGIKDYDELEKFSPEYGASADFATCLNSLVKFTGNHKALFIDEARQDVNHMMTSSTIKGDKEGKNTRAQHEANFRLKLNQADFVIAADADFDDLTMDYFIESCPGHEFIILETTPTIHTATHTILSNEWHPNVKDCEDGTEHNVSRHKIKEVLLSGSRATVACTSEIEAHATHGFVETETKEAIALGDYLQKECPDKRILVITGDNKGGYAQAHFIQNHNDKRDIPGHKGDLWNWDCVIFTSVLGSGVSLENDLYEHNFLLLTCILPANENLQLLGRNRNAKHNYVSFGRHSIASRVTDAAQLKESTMDGLKFLAEELGYETNLTPTKLSDYRDTIEAATNASLNDYENDFIQLAALRGRIFEHTKRGEVDEIKLSGDVNQKLALQAFNAQILSPVEFEAIDNLPARTQEQSDAVRRYNTCLMAGTDDISFDDTFNERRGCMSKVLNFEMLSKDDADLLALDLKDAISKDRRPGRVKVKRAALEVFQVLESLTELCKESALPICKILKRYHKELIEFGNFNKSIADFKDPVGTVKCFIEKFGYEVGRAEWHRRDGKAWRTYPFIFSEVILSYVNNRATLKA